MPDLIHPFPLLEDLALAELAQKHSESEADEILWREHMTKLKQFAGQG